MYAWLILMVALSLALMLLSFFLKSWLLYLMVAAAWVGVIVLSDNTWLQITASLGVAWAGITIFAKMFTGGYYD